MKCFYHPTKEALSICKGCAKGLCKECGTELKNGMACKDKCEDRVNMINKMLDNNAKTMTVANRQIQTAGYFGIILGVLFLILGVYFFMESGSRFFGFIFILIGISIALSGILRSRKNLQYPSNEAEDQEKRDNYST